MRSFTGETIPFSVHAYRNPGEFVMMQEILLDAYNLMANFIFFTDAKTPTLKEGVARTKFEVQAMSGSDFVVKELQVKGLATFTAY